MDEVHGFKAIRYSNVSTLLSPHVSLSQNIISAFSFQTSSISEGSDDGVKFFFWILPIVQIIKSQNHVSKTDLKFRHHVRKGKRRQWNSYVGTPGWHSIRPIFRPADENCRIQVWNIVIFDGQSKKKKKIKAKVIIGVDRCFLVTRKSINQYAPNLAWL